MSHGMFGHTMLGQAMVGHTLSGASSGVANIRVPMLGLAVLVHTLGMLLVAGTLALIVYQSYETAGLRLLQRAWFNFDLLWSIALLVAAAATLLI